MFCVYSAFPFSKIPFLFTFPKCVSSWIWFCLNNYSGLCLCYGSSFLILSFFPAKTFSFPCSKKYQELHKCLGNFTIDSCFDALRNWNLDVFHLLITRFWAIPSNISRFWYIPQNFGTGVVVLAGVLWWRRTRLPRITGWTGGSCFVQYGSQQLWLYQHLWFGSMKCGIARVRIGWRRVRLGLRVQNRSILFGCLPLGWLLSAPY